MKLDFEHFKAQEVLIHQTIDPSPVVRNVYLSNRYGANVYLKLENLLPVGSFKLRGAISKISSLSKDERKKTALAVSAGNHAQGVAWAARAVGMKALILMPGGSPLTKIKATGELGAEVRLIGESVEDCFDEAHKLLKSNDYILIHPYYDADIIAGQGSIAFELHQQLKNIDYVFSAIGGGGLTTGIGFALKHLNPKAKVIGAQASGANALVRSIEEGKYIETQNAQTIADGIKVTKPEPEMIKLIKEYTESVLSVSDASIALSILTLVEKARIVSEGAGAVALAALEKLYKQDPKKFKGKDIVLIICGGNIDLNMIDKIIDKGLVFTGRRMSFGVLLQDKPGTLRKLTTILEDSGANILQVEHDQNDLSASLLETLVYLRIEVKDKEHGQEVLANIQKEFKVIID